MFPENKCGPIYLGVCVGSLWLGKVTFFSNFLATPCGRWNHSSPTKDQTHAPGSGSRVLTTGKKSWKNYLCKTQFPYLRNGNSDGIMRIQCRNAVEVQYLALGIVAVQWQAAALPQLQGKQLGGRRPMLFCLLVQRASQDTVPSFNILNSSYYDTQHNLRQEGLGILDSISAFGTLFIDIRAKVFR